MEEFEYETDINALKEAGKVSREALDYAREAAKPGRKLLDLANDIERFIKGKGFDFAFPINLSINSDAAHYTPKFNDEKTFSDGDVLKVDLGARKGDTMVDCAETFDTSGKNAKMIDTCSSALDAAVSMVKSGRKLCDIGKEVERISKASGFNPIRNLGGHGVAKGELHAEIFVPNYDNGDDTELREGQVIAVEVFITDGDGYVKDGNEVEIFRKFPTNGPMGRGADARRACGIMDSKYSSYPFALRWLVNEMDSEFKARVAVRELSALGVVEEYPVLVERSNGIVAQLEKTLVVEKDSCIVIT
jgi:methionyl aminopeptidase